jgi:hypothetical protein
MTGREIRSRGQAVNGEDACPDAGMALARGLA